MRLLMLLAAALTGSASAAFVPVPYLSEAPVRRFDAPAWVIDPARSYRAVLTTSKGDITLDLFPRSAPKAVNNFVFLALNHYYDGTKFHRVIEGFVAQGGDPNTVSGERGTWGQGGPGYDFFIEIDRTLRFDKAGVLGMARTGDPHGQGSQFYITLAPANFLSGQYTVFGQVVGGLDVVQQLQKFEPGAPGSTSVNPDVIERVVILVDDGKER